MVKRSILGTILYAAFIKITIPVAQLINLGELDTLLSIIYGSIILGFCNGFILKSDSQVIERDYTGPDPRNETLFLMDMNSSAEHIDKPSKRR